MKRIAEVSSRNTSWSNWAGNQRIEQASLFTPKTEDELQQIVSYASANNMRIKAVGSGHSFTAIALAEEIIIDLSNYDEIVAIDLVKKTVTVQSGIQLSKLNHELHKNGLAMQNLGDIAYQTIAGAISTSTHGTGIKFTGIANKVVAFRIVLADASVVECSPET